MEKSVISEWKFINKKVKCFIENVLDEYSDDQIERLKIKYSRQEDSIKMAYVVGDGLKALSSKIRKNNPLGEFLGLDISNLNKTKKFFETYGFLYNLETENSETICLEDLKLIQERLLAFVNLINNQNELQQDIYELMNTTLFLLLKEYNIKNEKLKKYLVSSTLSKTINSSMSLDPKHKTVISQRNADNQKIIKVYSRFSKVLNKNIEIDIYEMQDVINNAKIPSSLKHLYYSFYQLDNWEIGDNMKLKIEFLFSFMYITKKLIQGDLKLKDFEYEFDESIFINNPNFKIALIDVSKILIQEEFERCLFDVKPTYNINEMKPDWKLPTFLSALYFSVYYKNSKNSMYRMCENENCRLYFQVSTTNSSKRYCSDSCRQNHNSKIQRQKKKSQLKR